MSTYNIMDYGAAPDGKTLCTEAVQRAIDLCGKGGTVLIPEGDFLCGAVFLKSDMTLYLERGARLLGSGNPADYPVMGYPYEGKDQLCYASLINTEGAPHENIGIDGEGTIDGSGVLLAAAETREQRGKRGRAVCIRNTCHVTIRNVTIRQSPAWCLHLLYCLDVGIENVKIHTKYDEEGNEYPGMVNGDGIDVDSCRNVRISSCTIASEDDCIAIKSGRDVQGRRAGVPSRDITVENCLFLSGFGVAIGSEMSGGVENVSVKNCRFEDAFSIASIKAIRGRGAYVRNIRYEDCTLKNTNPKIKDCRWFRGAIYADGFYGQEEFDADGQMPVDDGTPEVDGLYFKNLTLETVGGNAVYLCGLPERPYKNVYLENVRAHGIRGLVVKNIDNLRLIDTDITGDEA